MRNLIKLLIPLACLLPLAVHAQVSNPGVRYVTNAPSGSCSATPPVQVVISTGTIYTCNAGTWAAAGGGGAPTTCASGNNYACLNVANIFTADQSISALDAAFTISDTSTSDAMVVGEFSTYGYLAKAGGSPAYLSFDPSLPIVALGSTGVLGFTASTVFAAPDTGISRPAPATMAVGNGTQGDASGTIEAAHYIGLPLTINFSANSGVVATDAAPRLLAAHAGTIADCYVLTTAADASTPLTFNIFKNGTTILGGAQTVAAATSPGTISTFASATTFANNDIISIGTTSGTSSWDFSVQCK